MENRTRSEMSNTVGKPLRIGIIGAGLVGSTAALALSRLQHVEVVVLEKSPTSREAGAWISLTVTGLKVLTKLIEPREISEISYRPPRGAVYVTRHWRTGEALSQHYSSADLRDDHIQARTHRAPLLSLLQKHIAPGIVRFGHRVVDIVTREGFVEVECEGVSTEKLQRFDLLVAADGIYSQARQKFWPDHHVGYKGTVAYRTVFPVSKVKEIDGLRDDSSAWRKNGEVVFLSELGLGMYGIVIIRREDAEYASRLRWEHSIGEDGIKRLLDLYHDWDPVILKVLNIIETIEAYRLETGPWLRQPTQKDVVAFVGDAAHPTAGAFGAGAAMGFGDCWALYRALEVCGTERGAGVLSYDVPRALRIFQESRLPFLMAVEKQMAVAAADATYIGEAGGDESEWIRRFRERNPPNHWLVEHDVELEVQRAIASESLWTKEVSKL